MLVMLVIYLLLDFFESPPTSLHWSPLNGFQIKFLTLWALLHFQFNSLCENAQKMSFPSKSKGMTFFWNGLPLGSLGFDNRNCPALLC